MSKSIPSWAPANVIPASQPWQRHGPPEHAPWTPHPNADGGLTERIGANLGSARVNAFRSVDFPAFGRPTKPHRSNEFSRSQIPHVCAWPTWILHPAAGLDFADWFKCAHSPAAINRPICHYIDSLTRVTKMRLMSVPASSMVEKSCVPTGHLWTGDVLALFCAA